MANKSQKIGRDALGLSGLRASLQHRNESKRATKVKLVEPIAEYLRVMRDEPTIIFGCPVIYCERGPYVTKSGLDPVITFIGIRE